ncbi:hypothetical protein Bca52824_072527 [Brassica carinata]|uniref:Uncharacterized protein n=1 Tax=Brassica carinata TaxID=52824 RepID=A0A8X7Q8Y4_BRACI|nr:hypothetical protein Bca52824_072527 [Brassica carinata]
MKVSNTYHVDSLVSCMQIDVSVYAEETLGSVRRKRLTIVMERINTLQEALSELKNQPIGTNLRHYTGLHISGKHIYYGPYSKFYNSFVGYHDVIIEALEVIDGQPCGGL